MKTQTAVNIIFIDMIWTDLFYCFVFGFVFLILVLSWGMETLFFHTAFCKCFESDYYF